MCRVPAGSPNQKSEKDVADRRAREAVPFTVRMLGYDHFSYIITRHQLPTRVTLSISGSLIFVIEAPSLKLLCLCFPCASPHTILPGLIWYYRQSLKSILLNHTGCMTTCEEAPYVQLQASFFFFLTCPLFLLGFIWRESWKEHPVWEVPVKCHGHMGDLCGAAGSDLLKRKWTAWPPPILLKCWACAAPAVEEAHGDPCKPPLWFESHVYAVEKWDSWPVCQQGIFPEPRNTKLQGTSS